MNELNVITDAVRDEGGKWLKLSDQIAAIKSTAEQLHLDASAFFIGDANVLIHSVAYRDFHTFMIDILGGPSPSSSRSAERSGASPTNTTAPTR
ncbi:hypothetical protein [Micromonospora sp. 4G55]|uniref:hypothetical protein n=1 Tax=Micromonospora sp. 4G55 TaxID=2806102 RepID=UPI001EE4C2B8|nr:hypothetical protein [Micromonospora sp. 4G55]